MPPASPQDDFLNGVRRCVQTAPPGQLQAVVKHLHILISKTGGSEAASSKKKNKNNNGGESNSSAVIVTPKLKTSWFFKYINKIVFEHICNNLYLGAEIPYQSSEVGGYAILSSDNSIVKSGKTLDPTFVPDFLKESLDEDIVSNSEGGLHVVMDWSRRRLHVVDPIMLEVLRSCSFKDVLGPFGEPVAAYRQWVRELEDCDEEKDFAFSPLFDYIVNNYETLNKDKEFRNLLALHDVLSKSWRTNATSRFVDGAVTKTGTSIIFAENNNNNNNGGQKSKKSKAAFGIAFTLHSERLNSDAFWSARWKSRWVLSKDVANSCWALSGKVSVEYHSGEEGNIQMTASDEVSIPLTGTKYQGVTENLDKWIFGDQQQSADNSEEQHGEVGATLFAAFQPPMAAHTTNKTVSWLMDLARAVVKSMEYGEDSIQQKIEIGCGPLRSEAAIKALRRKMPLNNRLIDFAAIASSHAVSAGGKGLAGAQTHQQGGMFVPESVNAARESQFQ